MATASQLLLEALPAGLLDQRQWVVIGDSKGVIDVRVVGPLPDKLAVCRGNACDNDADSDTGE